MMLFILLIKKYASVGISVGRARSKLRKATVTFEIFTTFQPVGNKQNNLAISLFIELLLDLLQISTTLSVVPAAQICYLNQSI